MEMARFAEPIDKFVRRTGKAQKYTRAKRISKCTMAISYWMTWKQSLNGQGNMRLRKSRKEGKS